MTDRLLAIFRLNRGEGLRVALFALLGALIQCGLSIGMSTADSLFLAHVGVARLPVIYVMTPFVMLAYVSAYSVLISKLGIERVFQLTLAVLTFGGVAFASLFLIYGTEAAPTALYYCAKLYAAVWWIALYTLFWNFAESYFDILDAKRTYSLLAAACAAGSGLGGLMVEQIGRRAGLAHLFLVWAILALLTVPVHLLILKRCRSLEDKEDPGESRKIGVVEQTRNMATAIRNSRFVVLIIGVLFLTLVVTAVCEFRYMGVFSEGRTEHQLADLFGKLYASVSVFNLLITLLVFNWLVARIGVRNTALIQPVAYFCVFLWFLLDDSITPALFGFFAYQGLLVTVDYNNVNFLLNALPADTKKQVRTFIEGICEPLSTATAGLFLLLFAKNMGSDNLTVIGLVIAAVLLVLVLFLRAEYVSAMIVNLKRGWLDFSRPLLQLVRGRSADELSWLAEAAHRPPAEDALLAIRLLWLADKRRAADCLLDFITPPEPERCRAAQPLLAMMLADGDHEIIRLVLSWLDRSRGPLPATLIEELGQRGLVAAQDLKSYLNAAAPDARAAAASALAQSWKIADGAASLQTLNRLLNGSALDRRAAITGIGHSGQSRFVHFLVPVLLSGSRSERREALLAVRRLARRDSSRLLPAVMHVIVSGGGEERLFALEILERLADPDSIPPLLESCDDFSPQRLRQAESVLRGIGARGVPATVSCLVEAGGPYTGRRIAARALAHISFAQFEAVYPELIDSEIARAQNFLERHARLAGASTPGAAVLRRFYGDMPDTVIDFILELLGLGGRLPDFESVSASLGSQNAKDRANAVETVEQACSRSTFARLLPFIDGRPLEAKLAACRFYGSGISRTTDEEIVADACKSRFLIEVAAGIQSVWEKEPGRSRAVLLELMSGPKIPGLGPVLLGMTERISFGGREPQPTLVEKVHALSQTSLFAALRIQELAKLGAVARFFAADGVAADWPACGLVLEGEAAGASGPSAMTLRAGEIWGESSMWGDAKPPARVTARKVRALALEPECILSLARRTPRIAVALLRRQWENTHAA